MGFTGTVPPTAEDQSGAARPCPRHFGAASQPGHERPQRHYDRNGAAAWARIGNRARVLAPDADGARSFEDGRAASGRAGSNPAHTPSFVARMSIDELE